MLLLEEPYVSEFLQRTAEDLGIPVLDNGHIFDIIQNKNLNLLREDEFLRTAGTRKPLKLYCNSENSISWITENLPDTNLPGYIDFCKDKVKFRQMIRPLYPDFYFQEIDFNHIEQLDVAGLKKPFIIKPSVGFFSIGVYKVTSDEEWPGIAKHLVQDIKSAEGLYPDEVMNSSKFVIEECIEGDEFAIDAYYNSSGKPVILNILKHPFSSETDVSDRVYYTSKEIILGYLEKFQTILERIGSIAGFRDFPVHVEVRVATDGTITPIEFNPMRFAGWCVTDLAYFAYGINPYEYYFHNREPEWNEILKNRDGKAYSLVLVDLPKGLKPDYVKNFDYAALSKVFHKVLELRKIDFHKYPVVAFLFIEIPAGCNELEAALKMDFAKFVEIEVN